MGSASEISFSYDTPTQDDEEELLGRMKRAVSNLEALLDDERRAFEAYEAIKKQRVRLSDEVIPELMSLLGLDDQLHLADGRVIKVTRKTRAGVKAGDKGRVTDAERARAYSWLLEKGEEGLFKREVIVSFLPTEDVTELENQIRNLGFSPRVKLSVHHSTLESRLRKMHEESVDLPQDIFNVWNQSRTKVTRKK